MVERKHLRTDLKANSFSQAGVIITTRLIMAIIAYAVSNPSLTPEPQYVAMSCDIIKYMFGGETEAAAWSTNPCFGNNKSISDGGHSNLHVAVRADMNGEVPEIAAALGLGFGAGAWLAFFLHAVGVEIYVCIFFSSISSLSFLISISQKHHSTCD